MKSFLLFLCAGILPAQSLSVGVKGGVPLMSDIGTYWATSESKRYTVGPMISVGLPFGFRVEWNALYRRVGFRTSGAGLLLYSYTERDRGNSWEFPILAERALWRDVYAGVGYAPRVINGFRHVNSLSFSSNNPLAMTYSEATYPRQWETTHGLVLAAGIAKHVGPLRIAPEVRYTRWNRPAIDDFGPRGFSLKSTQNQVDLMLGISFP
jgi:hypothetical protein